jgi:diguanylate cyclase (GGDEF)-like protein
VKGRVPTALYGVGLALAAVYALTVAAGRAVPTALGVAAAATGVALGFALARAGAPRWAAYASAFVGLQIATWAGGMVGTAGATLCGAWGLALGLDAAAVGRAFVVAAAAALALLLAQAVGLVPSALGVGLLGGTGLCFAAGLALARAEPATPRASRPRQAAADEATRPRGEDRRPGSHSPEVDAAVPDASGTAPSVVGATPSERTDRPGERAPLAEPPPDAPVGLERTLRALRAELRAGRAVVWSVSAEDRVATPRVAEGGARPPVTNVEGDPLLWAAREATALRADRPPRWAPDAEAAGIAFAGELEGLTSVLTLEFDATDRLPELGTLQHAGARVAASLRLEAAEDEAGQRVRHAVAVLDATRRIAGRLEPAAIAQELCGAAVSLVGEGAALASWNGEGGVVLGSAGDLGGPQAGDEIVSPESQMAIAARSAAPIRRSRGGRGDGPPVAKPGERWSAPWRDLVVFPLAELDAGPVGVLAVWAREAGGLREEGLQWLEGVSGVAAAQLRNAERYDELRAEAEFDELTGLLNRRAFDHRFDVESARYQRYQRPVALLMIDIDHFKDVNDRHGHETGDAALERVAEAIASSVRNADIPARIGGEEFGVLLPETRVAEAVEVGERMRAAVAAIDLRHDGAAIRLRISIGVSACPDCVDGGEALRRSADEALYAAKRAGRDRIHVAPTPRIPEPGQG